MSTTVTHQDTQPTVSTTDRPDPDHPFTTAVWDDPEVCNHCFRRCKRITRASYRSKGTGTVHPVEHHDRTPDGTLGIDERDRGHSGRIREPLPRTTCSHCGSVRLLAQRETLSLDQALDRVPELVARLDEAGHDTSEEAAFAVIREFKSRQALQGLDREMFEMAVEKAIEWAGRLP